MPCPRRPRPPPFHRPQSSHDHSHQSRESVDDDDGGRDGADSANRIRLASRRRGCLSPWQHPSCGHHVALFARWDGDWEISNDGDVRAVGSVPRLVGVVNRCLVLDRACLSPASMDGFRAATPQLPAPPLRVNASLAHDGAAAWSAIPHALDHVRGHYVGGASRANHDGAGNAAHVASDDEGLCEGRPNDPGLAAIVRIAQNAVANTGTKSQLSRCSCFSRSCFGAMVRAPLPPPAPPPFPSPFARSLCQALRYRAGGRGATSIPVSTPTQHATDPPMATVFASDGRGRT